MSVTYRSSGLHQTANGSMYMLLQGSDGSLKQVAVELETPVALQDVILDSSSRRAHTWNHVVDKGYIASVCGVFGCCCCDATNLPARKAAMMAEGY